MCSSRHIRTGNLYSMFVIMFPSGKKKKNELLTSVFLFDILLRNPVIPEIIHRVHESSLIENMHKAHFMYHVDTIPRTVIDPQTGNVFLIFLSLSLSVSVFHLSIMCT